MSFALYSAIICVALGLVQGEMSINNWIDLLKDSSDYANWYKNGYLTHMNFYGSIKFCRLHVFCSF